jgi:epoxyqueuosine reductase
MQPTQLAESIINAIRCEVAEAETVTRYLIPLVGFVSAADPRFADLRSIVHPSHMMPEDLLPGARSVVSLFLPFDAEIVLANAREPSHVAQEWTLAYVQTNNLIDMITARLAERLAHVGVRAATVPTTHNFQTPW